MTNTSSTPSLSAVGRNDQIVFGIGFLALIFSFIDFAHVKIAGIGTIGGNISAWHGVGVLAGLLVLASIVVWAVAVLAPTMVESLPVSGRVIAMGLAILALLFFIIRWLTLPGGDVLGQHYGYSLAWGGYVTLVLVIAEIAFGWVALKSSGESMPWQQSSSAGAPPVGGPPMAPPAPVADPPMNEPPVGGAPTV